MNKDNIKETINNLLINIMGNNVDDARKAPKEVIETYKEALNKGNPVDNHYYTMTYPFRKMDKGLLLNLGIKKRETLFLLQFSDFVENHYERLIVKYEGSPCSADKSRTIMLKLFNYFENDVSIEFDFNQEYTYHYPEKIFKDQESILNFFNGLMRLYYGDPESYIIELQKLNQTKKT